MKTLCCLGALAFALISTTPGCAPSAANATVPKLGLGSFQPKSESPADAMVGRAQRMIATKSDDPRGYTMLGAALMQRGRETGVLRDYNGAMEAFEKSAELAPTDGVALHNLAWAHTMFHDFPNAIELSKRALAADPSDAFAYGVLFDSYMELGKYEDAERAGQRMVDLKPDLASYSRVSQYRWLIGDIKGACILMQRAIDAGGPFMENTAWCRTQLADMYFKSGSNLAAEQVYAAVLVAMPGYRHALAGMARIRIAQGRLDEGAELIKKAQAGTPAIPYAIELGDLYARQGKRDLAEAEYAKVEMLVEEHLAHGIAGDEVVLATFYLDHGRKLDEALRLAESEIEEHTSWQTYGVLAWAYKAHRRNEEAVRAIERALATGVQDALLWYRASEIYRASGDREKATKLALAANSLNPNFHILYASKPAE